MPGRYGCWDNKERIEQALARRHLQHGTLVLHDVTSTYFEGPVLPPLRRTLNAC
jgi:hypothetical protein